MPPALARLQLCPVAGSRAAPCSPGRRAQGLSQKAKTRWPGFACPLPVPRAGAGWGPSGLRDGSAASQSHQQPARHRRGEASCATSGAWGGCVPGVPRRRRNSANPPPPPLFAGSVGSSSSSSCPVPPEPALAGGIAKRGGCAAAFANNSSWGAAGPTGSWCFGKAGFVPLGRVWPEQPWHQPCPGVCLFIAVVWAPALLSAPAIISTQLRGRSQVVNNAPPPRWQGVPSPRLNTPRGWGTPGRERSEAEGSPVHRGAKDWCSVPGACRVSVCHERAGSRHPGDGAEVWDGQVGLEITPW